MQPPTVCTQDDCDIVIYPLFTFFYASLSILGTIDLKKKISNSSCLALVKEDLHNDESREMDSKNEYQVLYLRLITYPIQLKFQNPISFQVLVHLSNFTIT